MGNKSRKNVASSPPSLSHEGTTSVFRAEFADTIGRPIDWRRSCTHASQRIGESRPGCPCCLPLLGYTTPPSNNDRCLLSEFEANEKKWREEKKGLLFLSFHSQVPSTQHPQFDDLAGCAKGGEIIKSRGIWQIAVCSRFWRSLKGGKTGGEDLDPVALFVARGEFLSQMVKRAERLLLLVPSFSLFTHGGGGDAKSLFFPLCRCSRQNMQRAALLLLLFWKSPGLLSSLFSASSITSFFSRV